MSFSSRATGPIATAFVEITADTEKADRQVSAFIKGLSKIDEAAERTSDGISRAFSEAMRDVVADLRRAGQLDPFSDIERSAEDAGEAIQDSFSEAQRQTDEILREVGGPELFALIREQAESAGEAIENSFSEAQRGADEDLRDIGGAATFAPVRISAERAAESVERSFRSAAISSRVHLGAISIAAFGVAGALAVAGGATVAFGLQSAASLEQTQIGFEALLGSAQEAGDFIRDLQEFAATTPFEFQGLANNARQILAMGAALDLTREDVIPFLTTVGDLTSVLGQPPEAIDRIIRAFSQMSSKGKVTTEELLQIAEAVPGFPIFQAMADGLGLTTAELQKQVSEGTIPAKEGIDAIIQSMEEFPGAAGAMAKQAQTLTGLFSTFKDTISLALTDAFQPLVPTVKTALADAIPIIEESLGTIAPALSGIAGNLLQIVLDVAEALGPAFGTALQGLADAFASIGESVGTSVGVLRPVFEALNPLIAAFGQALQPVIRVVGALAGSVLPPFINLLTNLLEVIQPVLDTLGTVLAGFFEATAPFFTQLSASLTQIAQALVPLLEVLADVFGRILTAVEPFIPVLNEVVAILATGLIEAIEVMTPALEEVAAAFTDAFISVLEDIGPDLPELAEALASIAVSLAEILVALTPLLTPLIQLGALVTRINFFTQGLAIQGLAVVLEALAGVATFIRESAGPAFDAFTGTVSDLWHNVLVPFGQFVAAAFIAPFIALGAFFTGVVIPAAQTVGTAFMNLWHGILEPVANFIINVLVVYLRTFISIMIGPLVIGISLAIETFQLLYNTGIRPVATFLASVLIPVINILIAVLKGTLKVSLDVVINTFSFLYNSVLVPFGRFLSGVFSASLTAVRGGIDLLSGAVRVARDVFNAILNSAIKPLVSFLKATAQPAIAAFETAWDGVAGAVRIARRVIDTIIDVIEDAIGLVADLIDKIENIPGAGTVGNIVGAIPGLQGGGIITQDTLAQLHAPEVVIPLNDPARALELVKKSGLLNTIAPAAAVDEPVGAGAPAVGGGITVGPVTVNFQGAVTPAEAQAGADAFVDAVEATVRRRQVQLTVRTI